MDSRTDGWTDIASYRDASKKGETQKQDTMGDRSECTPPVRLGIGLPDPTIKFRV